MTAVHLARFGDRGGEHTVLGHSGADPAAVKDAVWRTDLPPQGDPETMGTFVAGYPIADLYVVQHTRPDLDATRPGMVATTAAFIPRSLLAAVALGPLFALVAAADDELNPVPAASLAADPGPHTHAPGAAALASTLLTGRRAIWTGEGMPAALACLWYHLSPSERASLAFGAAFHPDAIPVSARDGGLIVVYAPEPAAARFSGWPAVSAASAEPDDPARAAFFGDGDPSVGTLAAELLDSAVGFDQWRHLVALADLRSTSGNAPDHEQLRAQVQLLGLLAPDPAVGRGLKEATLSQLRALTAAAAFGDIRGLRGLPWPALPGPGGAAFLEEWAAAATADATRTGDVGAAVSEATTQPVDAFRQQLDRAMHAAVGATPPSVALAAAMVGAGEDALAWLLAATARGPQADHVLAEAVNGLLPVEGWVAEFARRHRLRRTHAAAVDVTDPVAAWRSHLAIAGSDDEAAAATLASRCGDDGTLRAALALDNSTLARLAANAATRDPRLLQPLDVTESRRRAIWAAVVTHGGDPWMFARPHDVAEPLLDLVVDNAGVDEALLGALAETSAANLAHNPRRPQVWAHLPEGARSRMLAATADDIARRLGPEDAVPEPPLVAAILQQELLGAVAHDDTAQALRLVAMLPGAGPEHAVVVARRGRFDAASADTLGRLVVERRWKRSAESITDLASSRSDLRPAASRVAGMFGVLERLRRLAGISDGVRGLATDDELRDALHDLVANLYPAGPMDTSVWERAGGSAADCPDGRDGRHRWGLALAAIAAGRAGAPSRDDLLRTMGEDYPGNRDLAALATVTDGRS